MSEIISIATQNPIFVKPIDPLKDAVEIMAKNGFRRLPVVWENALVGIITASDVLRAVSPGKIDVLMNEIHNYMTPEPITVFRNTGLSEAIQMMFQHDLGSLLIISTRNELAGIVTERDLVRAFSQNSVADADLMEFIIKEPITHSFATTTVKKIVDSMVEENIRRAILVDKNNKVKGIVTITDIIRYISDHLMRTNDLEEKLFAIKAKDIARTKVHTVNVSSSVSDVADLLVENKIGGLPVVNNEGKLIGVFTERDILKLVGTYKLI